GCKQNGHWSGVICSHDGGASRANGIKHRSHVLGPVLPRWRSATAYWVRHARATAIKNDVPADGSQAPVKRGRGWQIPDQVDVAAQSIVHDQIDRSVADDLIAHLRTVDLDIVGLGWERAHSAQS